MNLIDLVRASKKSSKLIEGFDSLYALEDYQRMRKTSFRLNNFLVTRLSKNVLMEGARRLGMLRGDTIYLDSEYESSVLRDYCIYNVRFNGQNAVENYLAEQTPEGDSDEERCLRAMQHATYTLLIIKTVERNLGCVVYDLFSDKIHLLVDRGLSVSLKVDDLVCTRVLDFDKYIMTGGAALPIGEFDKDKLNELLSKFRQLPTEPNSDPAEIIRHCIHRKNKPQVDYIDAFDQNENTASTSRRLTSRTVHRAHNLLNQSTKPDGSVRCRCKSGKMYKNCCGKN